MIEMDTFLQIAKPLAVVLWGVVVGLLAKRKHKNPWLWGVLGAFSWVIALAILALLPHRCPKCDQVLGTEHGKNNFCPGCGPLDEARNTSA